MSALLLIQFSGWCLLRLPTDPDPSDEPRGISGYTFAFAGEPDLDAILHFQQPENFTHRSHCPAIGVNVRSAQRFTSIDQHESLPALVGAPISLLDRPQLQNRNWNLTLPGYEPIVPFHFQIAGQELTVRRDAPLDPNQPDRPLWEMDSALIQAQGAHGMEFEPETIGKATGIWNSLAVVQQRQALLQKDLEALQAHNGDPVAIAALEGRLYELNYAIANPTDRRVLARNFVERFGFFIGGPTTIRGNQQDCLGGVISSATTPTPPWRLDFWMGAWDPDALSCYVEGSLQIPYLS